MPRHLFNYPEWVDQLQVGDVLRRGKDFRVVREVTLNNKKNMRGAPRVDRLGKPQMISFSILKCSWTHRPYTCYNVREVVISGWIPAGFRLKLDRLYDKLLAEDLHKLKDLNLDCCDVVGVLR